MKRKTIRLLLCIFFGIWSTIAFSQARKTVTGHIKDNTGNAVIGATVKVKGSQKSVASDADGKFEIQAAPTDELIITSVGFEMKEFHVGAKTDMAVSLTSTTGAMGEVVVTALGIKRDKRSVGYATTTIKSDEIIKTGATNFATALYGKVPGLKISAGTGGATSGVAIQLRGVNSILFRTTPLIIMDGVPIHDGDGFNVNGGRIGSNGLVDLNPEDIESITVLKGAAAAALYGSEATNGVLLITTKSGKGAKGLKVDFNANYTVDKVAYTPDYQDVRGSGMPVQLGIYTSDANGFTSSTFNGAPVRAPIQGSLNFGPKFDGKPILCWDGVVRPYSAQKNNYDALFQDAHNKTVNLAISSSSENSNTRFSVTHINNEGVSLNAHSEKITANLNSTFRFGKKFSTDLLINYIHQDIHNRPYTVDRLINNFSGMLPRFDNGQWYLNKYKTSLGYKYVTGSNQSLTPGENLTHNNLRGDILDFVWNVKENQLDEFSNRLIGSITNNWQIHKNLRLRGRISTDITSGNTIGKSTSSIPTAYGYSGGYGISSSSYNIVYGDVLLTYSKKLSNNLDLSVMGGYTADKEFGYTTGVNTNGGLSTENNFNLASSYLTVTGSGSSVAPLVKDAFISTLNLSFKNYLFLEGTLRRDRTSTMNPNNNTFVYPAINSGFVFSDAVKLPDVVSYAKLRASWGIVGNYPQPYLANIAYNPGNIGIQQAGTGSVLTTQTQNSFGNNNIRPEKKHEYEFGLETKFFKNRLSLDVSYYNAKIVDQILNLTLPQSTGAGSILTNIGVLTNHGIEIALSVTLKQTKNFTWESGINFAFNKNKIVKLANGLTEIIHGDFDGNAAVLKSVVGQAIGDFYAHPVATDAKGQKIVGDDGIYALDAANLKDYGNAMPKSIGGYFNTFRYKSFSAELFVDFRLGGYVMPSGFAWLNSRGLTKESLKGMDKEHGGLSYYLDANGNGIQTSATQGPTGQPVFNDGVLMQGVKADGKINTNVISQAYYYWNIYNWGGPQYSESEYFLYIKKNSYVKMREISIAYSIPFKIADKIKAKSLQLSIFARNLFYLYRSIKGMDAEQLTSGSKWSDQITNAGTNPSTRTYGIMLRASF